MFKSRKFFAIGAITVALSASVFLFQNFSLVNTIDLAEVSKDLGNLSRVTAGVGHTCALTQDADVLCWGSNKQKQLGTLRGPASANIHKLGRDRKIVALRAGDDFTCSLDRQRRVRCWGDNKDNQLAGSRITDAYSLDAGGKHACVITKDQRVNCWGDNSIGQLGHHPRVYASKKLSMVPDIKEAVAVSTGDEHTCVIHGEDRSISCWGYDHFAPANKKIPFQVPEVVEDLKGVEHLAAGGGFTCALLSDSTVKCWGRNEFGQLGDGSAIDSETPVLVKNLSGVRQIAAGSSSVCAVLNDGSLSCWGGNQFGQLATGDRESLLVPEKAENITDIQSITMGKNHGCAVLQNGTAKCWGLHQSNAIKDPEGADSLVAADVSI